MSTLSDVYYLEGKLNQSDKAILELVGKVQYLIDFIDSKGFLEDGRFIFPDGDTWMPKRLMQ